MRDGVRGNPSPVRPAAAEAWVSVKETAEERDVLLEPFFDQDMPLEPGRPVTLRVRAVGRRSGKPLRLGHVSFSIFGESGDRIVVPAHDVGEGLYEAPFTPGAEGPYRLAVQVDGAGSIAALGSEAAITDGDGEVTVSPSFGAVRFDAPGTADDATTEPTPIGGEYGRARGAGGARAGRWR